MMWLYEGFPGILKHVKFLSFRMHLHVHVHVRGHNCHEGDTPSSTVHSVMLQGALYMYTHDSHVESFFQLPEATLIFIFPLPQVSFFLSFFLHVHLL